MYPRRSEGHTVAHGVIAPLLARNDDVRDALALLKALGRGLDLAVPVEHVEDPVGRVQALVFSHEVRVHCLVGRPERVDVGLVDGVPWEADGGPCPRRDDLEVGATAERMAR